MTRNFKPGDVAIVRQDGEDRVALRGTDDWVDSAGDSWGDDEVLAYGSPLVVIDPDDPYEVERLIAAFFTETDKYDGIYTDVQAADAMQTALRVLSEGVTP